MVKYRKLHGLKSHPVTFAQISSAPLSEALDAPGLSRLYLCGSLAAMSREYVEEPLSRGWKFARRYVHKFRSPVYERNGQTVSIKLIGESWLPGCESVDDASLAWQLLNGEWERTTGLPLLSTPSKTGQALLWESLPKGEEFASLPDDLAQHIRSISTQHRNEVLQPDYKGTQHCYDGRWMYASLVSLDRLPIGEPIQTREFEPYQPGWYRVRVTVPREWAHIGLLPLPIREESELGELRWRYPSEPGEQFEVWASEPELTIAKSQEWKIEVIEGWRFTRGRPLANWGKKLTGLREQLKPRNEFAAAAAREILNHTIGTFHTNTYERDVFIPDEEWKEYVKANGVPHKYERVEGGRIAPQRVAMQDHLSIYMPHWSSQVWALERARIAQHALKCNPASIIEIRGDAIYVKDDHVDHSAFPLWPDNGNLGQLRWKGVSERG